MQNPFYSDNVINFEHFSKKKCFQCKKNEINLIMNCGHFRLCHECWY